MWLFYLGALIPVIIGLVIFLMNKQIVWQEYVASCVLAFIMAGIFHGIAIVGMTDDKETWSGQIANVAHHPEWVEEWQEAIYKTEYYWTTETYYTGTGNNRHMSTRRVQRSRRVFSHYETRHTTHPQHWTCVATYGTDHESRDISYELYADIKAKFGNVIEDGGKQGTYHGGHHDGGDNNIYLTQNKTGYIVPVTTIKHFENRIKAAPTTFSFMKVPSNAPVYEWPENPTWMQSDRLLGESRISPLKFDQMNSRLGPRKRVNVIMINFHGKDSSVAHMQEAKWVGGKKNDLVLCYGLTTIENGPMTNDRPNWAYVFGWTESEICKKNLQTILLTNPMNDDILDLIEAEIRHSYIIKDWSKFDYISIEPPTWSYIAYFISMIVIQVGCWLFFHLNEFGRTVVADGSYKVQW